MIILFFIFLYLLLPRELQYQNIIKSRCETHILKTRLHLYIKMIHVKFIFELNEDAIGTSAFPSNPKHDKKIVDVCGHGLDSL